MPRVGHTFGTRNKPLFITLLCIRWRNWLFFTRASENVAGNSGNLNNDAR